MKTSNGQEAAIRIAVVESDPLRFVGFRALFDAEPDFELIPLRYLISPRCKAST